MKKILIVFLVIVLALSLIACDKKSSDNQINDNITVPNETTDNTTEDPTNPTNPEETVPTTDPQHTHEYAQTVIAPTCTQDGYTEYRCECGEHYTDNKQTAVGHAFGQWEIAKDPTAMATGLAERKCSVCNEVETKTLGKLEENHEHSYNSKTTKVATCATVGVVTFSCSCGDSYTEDIPKTEHVYTEKVVAPTCTNEGYTKHTCKCGDSYTDNKIDANGHSYLETVTAPTCTANGYTNHRCSVCGDSYKDTTVKATGHKYVDTVTAPTCTKDGFTIHKCSVCGDSYKDTTVKTTGHTYVDREVKPTCQKGGYTEHTCSACKNTYKDNYTDIIDHNYVVTDVEATCTEKGYTLRQCTMCGDNKKTNIVNAYGHEYETTKYTASCTTDGYTLYSCRYCDSSYKENIVKATGHRNQKTIEKPAECIYSGYVRVVCVDCDATISEKTLPAPETSHTYTTMRLSDAVKIRADKGNYDYAKWSNYKDWNVKACTKCNHIDVDSIEFAYTAYEAAVIMLGYVNDLRASVYGNHAYDLKLNTTLVNLATIRAEEIRTNFSHDSNIVNTYAGENITNSGPNIYDHFLRWKNSSGHYKNMIDKDYTEFGYASYKLGGGTSTSVYGVQLFWTPEGKACYFDQ